MITTEDITIAPACGPNIIASSTAPTICPLVPGIAGNWKFIICAAKTKALETDNRGVKDREYVALVFLQDQTRNAIETAYIKAQIAGLKKPSGICIIIPR